ncbi:hypothetical protein P152DRAFT_458777 [Eremomyces bilateralis CBS 781.70]|uniref:Uncharacterized protein n=1 Tax=Eremomyces bilateralis CBS 781.70 TaxID=1392243 RepID=A0A6G1G2R6_9PEZI|nr:uncharacterized protein P152DRAFT_458777 [Eremomyces bilateralis CBS 781.70]KAF1812407.1 hypothetical protein P152DRAFT_458777 [Eremomyces bilateralis CBS 781.70]
MPDAPWQCNTRGASYRQYIRSCTSSPLSPSLGVSSRRSPNSSFSDGVSSISPRVTDSELRKKDLVSAIPGCPILLSLLSDLPGTVAQTVVRRRRLCITLQGRPEPSRSDCVVAQWYMLCAGLG